eukprot:gb/GEZN01011560.1/.p1 GENE.gb/GEZN01011560.1/~~gb/GEZN01011560.1/.p1  ORF type:complete len:292 (-),score=29.94 gb/GEZN01011560.1/:247-1122(-)
MADRIRARLLQSAVIRTLGVKHRPAPSLMYFPGLTQKELIYRNEDFPWTKELEGNLEPIRAEFLRLRRFQGNSDYLTKADEHTLHVGAWDWYSYVTKGKPSEVFEQQCPVTASILKGVPGFMTGVPFAYSFFSALASGSKIDPHFAPCNLRLRCHFPLFVPDELTHDCGMRVGNEMVTWEEGKCIIFDDSFEHETWNLRRKDMEAQRETADKEVSKPRSSSSDREKVDAKRVKEDAEATALGHGEIDDDADRKAGRRVVLLFDVWHPDLEPDECRAISQMFDSTLRSMHKA